MASISRLASRPGLAPPEPSNLLKTLLLRRSSQSLARPREPLNPISKRLPWSYRRQYHQGGGHDWFQTLFGIDKGTGIIAITIAINCAVFIYQWYPNFLAGDGGDPRKHDWIEKNIYNSGDNVKEGRWWVMLNSSFAHGNILHLAFNMLGLWNLGGSFVRVYGFWSFAGLWAVSAFACSAAHIYWHNTQKRLQMETRRWDSNPKYTVLGIPISKARALAIVGSNDPSGPNFGGGIGASGVLTGMIGTFLADAPTMPASFLLVPGPLWLTQLVFVAGSAYCLATDSLSGLGHAGHIGGMVAGVAYYFVMLRRFRRF